MNSTRRCLALVAMLGGPALAPCLAASLAASSISESIGASIGSVSASVQRSSDSSSKTKPVAAGDYTVIDIASLADTPGKLRLTLRALATDGADGSSGSGSDTEPDREFYLILPQRAFDQSRLVEGSIVTARRQRYGLEFIHAGSRQSFFLVVDDDAFRELQTYAVVL